MPSSKGKPTDPQLREEVKEKVKNETNKDGGGKGQWSAWKAAKLSKEYEKKGGDYENESGSKNEPKKGTPQPKSSSKKKADVEKGVDKSESPLPTEDKEDTEEVPGSTQKPKANTKAKKDAANDAKKSGAKSGAADRPEGTRRSTRIAGAGKRKTYGEEDGEEGSTKKKKVKKNTKS